MAFWRRRQFRRAAAAIYRYIRSHELSSHVAFEANGRFYGDRPAAREELGVYGFLPHMPMPPVIGEEDIDSLAPVKILLPYCGPIYEELSASFRQSAHIMRTDGNRLIQIMERSVAKEAALGRILGLEGIAFGHTVAFGDDLNDLGLFEACGFGIAMANAVPELIDRAFAVTASNDDEGVALVLEHLAKSGNLAGIPRCG